MSTDTTTTQSIPQQPDATTTEPAPISTPTVAVPTQAVRPTLKPFEPHSRAVLPKEQDGWLICKLVQYKPGGDWCFTTAFGVDVKVDVKGLQHVKLSFNEWDSRKKDDNPKKNHSGWLSTDNGWTAKEYIVLQSLETNYFGYMYYNPTLEACKFTVEQYSLDVLGEQLS